MPPVLEEGAETLEQYALPNPRLGAGSERDCCLLVFPKLQEPMRQDEITQQAGVPVGA